jgi:capsid portal protein
LFNYFFRVLKIVEDKDSYLLSNLYFKDGRHVIAIQYVVVDEGFDENDFELLSEKYLPLFL